METQEGGESATMLSKCNIAQLPADVTMTLEAVFKLLCVSALLWYVDLDSIAASGKPGDAAFVAKYQKLIGVLLYLSVNTIPEIGFVMTRCLTYTLNLDNMHSEPHK
jgi:hypothetical protein